MDAVPPDPPWNRIERYGEAWGIEWRRAWIAMAVHDRVPSYHFIDNVLKEPRRAWMRESYGDIAALTATGGACQWVGWVPNRATLGVWQSKILVRLDEETRTIMTAFNI